MASTDLPKIFNLAVANVGQNRRTDAIKSKKKHAGKINKLMVTVAIEKAATAIDSQMAAKVAFARDQRPDDRESDSHNGFYAVRRSTAVNRGRQEKQRWIDSALNGVTDEDIGEQIVASINRSEVSLRDSDVKPAIAFRRPISPRTRAVKHLRA